MKDTIRAYNFARRRKEVGLNPRWVAADAFGVSVGAIKKWEYGERRVPKHAWNELERLEKQKAGKDKQTGPKFPSTQR